MNLVYSQEAKERLQHLHIIYRWILRSKERASLEIHTIGRRERIYEDLRKNKFTSASATAE